MQVALRLTDEMLNAISIFADADATETLGDTPYIVARIVGTDPLELNMKLMTEEQMVEEFKNDPELHILS